MGWYKRYVLFQKPVCGQMRHPSEMGATEVGAFLTNLAVNRDVSPATQNQKLDSKPCGEGEPLVTGASESGFNWGAAFFLGAGMPLLPEKGGI